MKIYLFNPENGIYLGEDYADEEPLKRCSYRVPSDATTIAPPQVVHGGVPVFNTREQQWELRSINDFRRKSDNGDIS